MSQLLSRLINQRAELSTQITGLLTTVQERAATSGDDQLTEAETANMAALDADATRLDERIAQLEAIETREADAAALAVRVQERITQERNAATGRPTGGATTREQPTYHERSTHSWVLDVLATQRYVAGLDVDLGEAQRRLERHQAEMADVLERDSTTATFNGLVPPAYLLSEFAPNLRAGRPFANMLHGLPLQPGGMSMIIPRATAATTVSIQATQNTNPTTTDMAITDLSVPVNTFMGRGVISRQALERGGVNIDRIVFDDLAADAARFLDQQALYGTGAGGNALGAINTAGIISVAITGTTGLDLIKAVANAIQAINTQRLAEANAIFMHPRRWGALTIATDTANRPLVTVEAGQMNVFGQGEAAGGQRVVGSMLGLPVVTDPNLRTNLGAGTNQDEVLVIRREDVYLWEQSGSLREFTFEQPVGPASIQLAVYGNFAFTAARYPTAVAYISGAGLVPPTF